MIKIINYIIISIGLFARCKHYFDNRSFWMDESWVALDISTRSFMDILRSTRFSADLPIVPMGFALVEKLMITAFGNNEFSFRFFPLICSCFALILFYHFLKKNLRESFLPYALALFAFCGPLIYYAAELKQYSTELLVALVLYLFHLNIKRKEIQLKDIYFYALLSVGAVCFSHTAIFILGSFFIVQFLKILQSRSYQKMKQLCLANYFWMLAVLVLYIVAFRHMLGNSTISEGALRHFVPHPLFSSKAVLWVAEAFRNMFSDPGGMSLPIIGFGLFVLGSVYLYRQESTKFWIYFLPILFALGAAVLHKYPFTKRFLIFYVPSMFLFIGYGIQVLLSRIKKMDQIFGILIASILLYYPLKSTLQGLFVSHVREEFRPIMQHLRKHARLGDVVYLNNASQYSYIYYSAYYQLPNFFKNIAKISDDVYGDGERSLIFKEFIQLDTNTEKQFFTLEAISNIQKEYLDSKVLFDGDKRAWFIFSHEGKNLQPFLLAALDDTGKRINEVHEMGASMYLYDLGR